MSEQAQPGLLSFSPVHSVSASSVFDRLCFSSRIAVPLKSSFQGGIRPHLADLKPFAIPLSSSLSKLTQQVHIVSFSLLHTFVSCILFCTGCISPLLQLSGCYLQLRTCQDMSGNIRLYFILHCKAPGDKCIICDIGLFKQYLID